MTRLWRPFPTFAAIGFLLQSSLAFSNDFDIRVQFNNETETRQLVSDEWQECSGAEQFIHLSQEVSTGQKIAFSDKRTTEVGATVPFKGVEVSVGAAIERQYAAEFASEQVSVSAVTITVPRHALFHYEYDVVETWVHGTVHVTKRNFLFPDEERSYAFRRLKRVDFANIRTGNERSCLRTKDVTIENTWELDGFTAMQGDCEMDTNTGDVIRIDLKSQLNKQIPNIAPPGRNAVWLGVEFNAYEGKGEGYGNTKIGVSRDFIVQVPEPGWRIKSFRKPLNVNISRFPALRGRSHGWHTLSHSELSRSYWKKIDYKIDGPGGDCERARVRLHLKLDVELEEIP